MSGEVQETVPEGAAADGGGASAAGAALEFHAAAIAGTESVLCDELRELGLPSVRFNRGGIPFRGTWRDGWRACLQSRIAQRIQVLLARFPAPTAEALYTGVQTVDWLPFVTARQTLAVSAVCRASALQHSGFIALKVKDAIVDQIRARTGGRPDVADDPDARVFLYLVNDKAALYLDLAGEPLHKRGYRREAGEAPLRETLAAAVLRLSGWDRKRRLIDPMCGSGTIAIEAALWAANFAPGLLRERFGFERWANFGAPEAAALRTLRGELRSAVTAGRMPRIVAADSDPAALDMARRNARLAGVRLAFREQSLFDMQPDPQPALVVTNPPYGVRLATDPLYVHNVTGAFCRLHGWQLGVLAGTAAYAQHLSLHPRLRVPLVNGDLPCEFLLYDIP